MATHPAKITSKINPATYGLRYETIQFMTSDNVLIKGWFIPNNNPTAKTIILLHGYPADKSDILPLLIFLSKQYNLLLFDFRYLGESQGSYSTIGVKEILDLRAALKYLNTRGINEVGVWGFSMGAAVALLTAPNSPEIKAIVADAPYARLDWMANDYFAIPGVNYIVGNLLRFWAWLFLEIDIKNVRPVNAVQKIKVPLLFIYHKRDQVIRYEHMLLIQEAIRNHPRAKIVILDQSHHGEVSANYQNLINDFFDHNMN